MHMTVVQHRIFSGACCLMDKTPPCPSRTLHPPSFPLLAPTNKARTSSTDTKDMLRMRYNVPALFTAGGGDGGMPPGRSTSSSRFLTGLGSSSSSAVAAEPGASQQLVSSSSSVGGDGRAPEVDVPQTVMFNGETLVFGDYRRSSLLEKTAITFATVSPIAWKTVHVFRNMKRTWAKATVAIVSPCLAWLARNIAAYIYKQTVLQPKLRTPESVKFPNSQFQDVGGLKVHSIRESPGPEVVPKTVLHMNHGFGASSLSWSPVIKQLSGAFDAVAVAHDTPGFGLTDRPGFLQVDGYSLRSNAAITGQLVQEAKRAIGGQSIAGEAPSPRYILVGHSMGCITAATVSLDPSLPPNDTTLVLVAPALSPPSKIGRNTEGHETVEHANAFEGEGEDAAFRGGGGVPGRRAVRTDGETRRGAIGTVVGVPASGLRGIGSAAAWVFNWCLLPLLYPVEILGIRSLVYRGNFWRAGLRLAWFNKAGVDLDLINRYRWPSLVRNWDRGMVLFLLEREQIGKGGAAGPPGLVEAVAAKAARGMKVVLIQGENDKLVNLEKVRTGILGNIPGAKLVVMKNCGHVPHEERPDEFIRIVSEEVRDWTVVEDAAAVSDNMRQQAPPS